MDKGYSNLLSEILPASDIGYDDAADLQIVCHACREPVYKAVRRGSREIHYLAHYEASRSAIADCELRVGSLGANAIADINRDSRRQNLEYFLAVFAEMLKETLDRAYEPAHPATIMAIGRHKTIAAFRDVTKHRMHAQFSETKISQTAARIFSTAGRDLFTLKAKHLGASRQASITIDILRTLLGGASARNFNLLFTSAWAIAMEWTMTEENAPLTVSLGLTPEALYALWRAPFTSRQKALQMIEKVEQQTDSEGRLGTTGLCALLEMFMVDLLLATDYLGWLARRIQSKAGSFTASTSSATH